MRGIVRIGQCLSMKKIEKGDPFSMRHSRGRERVGGGQQRERSLPRKKRNSIHDDAGNQVGQIKWVNIDDAEYFLNKD